MDDAIKTLTAVQDSLMKFASLDELRGGTIGARFNTLDDPMEAAESFAVDLWNNKQVRRCQVRAAQPDRRINGESYCAARATRDQVAYRIAEEKRLDMSYKLTALLLASIVLSACVGLPSNPDGQATYYIDQAKAAYSSGQKEAAGNFIWAALIKPTGADKVRNAFKDSPGLQSAYFDNVSRRISRIRDLFDVDGTLAELDLAKRTSVFTSAQVATLETSFSEVISYRPPGIR
ncbi:MAG: hypothetical protein IPG52_16915 [Rhodocyclaceae bacterium]|nr:hypothetical protein [Rhodocyclaceae bacterium]